MTVEPKSERDVLGVALPTMVASLREIVGQVSAAATHLSVGVRRR